jgi:hypothetical protein
MRITLAALLIIFGLLTLATPALLLGLAMIVAGGWLFTKVTVRDEEGFTAGLFILGALGAIAPFVSLAWKTVTGWLR